MAYTPTTTVVKSATIKAGETFVLPSGATIVSLVSNGDAVASSLCDLPEVEEYVCSYFKVTLDSSDIDGRPMDEPTTLISSITVGDKVFDFNGFRIIKNGGSNSEPPNIVELNALITDLGLFSFTRVGYTQVSQRQVVWLHFKTPASYLPYTEMKVLDNGNSVYFKANGELDCSSTDNP